MAERESHYYTQVLVPEAVVEHDDALTEAIKEPEWEKAGKPITGKEAVALIGQCSEYNTQFTRNTLLNRTLFLTPKDLAELRREEEEGLWLPTNWRWRFVETGEVLCSTFEDINPDQGMALAPEQLGTSEDLKVAQYVVEQWLDYCDNASVLALGSSDQERRQNFLEWLSV